MKKIAHNQITVSIIIPHFQRWECLKSFVDGLPLEIPENIRVQIIIIDDASSLKLGKSDFLKSLNSVNFSWLEIQYHEMPNNIGAPGCRNYGFEHSTGNYIHFLDSDDKLIWIRYFETLSNFEFRYKNICAVISGFNNHTNFLGLQNSPMLSVFNWIGPLSGVIFRKSSIKDIRFDEKLESAQDWDFFVQCMKRDLFKWRRVNKVFFEYTHSINSITNNREKFLNGRLYFYKKNIMNLSFISRLIFLSSVIIFSLRRKMFSELGIYIKQTYHLNNSTMIEILFLPIGFFIYSLLKIRTLLHL